MAYGTFEAPGPSTEIIFPATAGIAYRVVAYGLFSDLLGRTLTFQDTNGVSLSRTLLTATGVMSFENSYVGGLFETPRGVGLQIVCTGNGTTGGYVAAQEV